MDWEWIMLFAIGSVVAGVMIGCFEKKLLLGVFITLFFLGFIITAVIIMTTGYDGIFVWLAGPAITTGPFLLVLKFRYPEKWFQLYK